MWARMLKATIVESVKCSLIKHNLLILRTGKKGGAKPMILIHCEDKDMAEAII
jgi:hypothetical protein